MDWYLASDSELEEVVDFFHSVDNQTNPPFSSYPHTLDETVHLWSQKGGVLISRNTQKDIVGLLGYFEGVPQIDSEHNLTLQSPHIAYVYAFVVHPSYRGLRTIRGVKAFAEEAEKKGFKSVQFKAYAENNDSINKLYSRRATVISKQVNTQNKLCYLYETSPYRLLNLP